MIAFWFRRDLRLEDNAALYHALKTGQEVMPVFIFDSLILEKLPRNDKRVQFIHETITDLAQKLKEIGAHLQVFYGNPTLIWQEIAEKMPFTALYTNHDYEPYPQERDAEIAGFLSKKNITFHTYKDHVIFEKAEILSNEGKPYTVFTPYSRKWKATLNSFYLKSYPTEKYFAHFAQNPPIFSPVPSLAEMGFEETKTTFPAYIPDEKIIQKYHETRDFPAQKGTTRLGLHLRFGTISIRKLAKIALAQNETYLNELIWRDFYAQILWNFPYVVGNAFKKEYDKIEWENDEKQFKKWCEGKTGYPLVDAGMRELNATGYMHNRVRMLVASFLCKHLLIDWRWGEAYFAEKLLDFELASNNGGWQWAAGSGCDAAPYFRIFSPEAQLEKFDKQLQYVRKWVPEFGTPAYIRPIVEHKWARERCLATYKKALNNAE